MLTDGSSYQFATWIFLRALGVIYLIAFASLRVQVLGLIGSRGILPAKEFLRAREGEGRRRFLMWPTLFWLSSGDRALTGACSAGMVLALLLVLGIAPVPVLFLLWLLYLSLFTVGRSFLGYQWDVLLLEAGFLSIFLAPLTWFYGSPVHQAPPLVLWLFWWLLFRLMFSSGVVKLRSGDRSWRDLTALTHHYETQPLPTRLAWHAHQLPRPAQRFSAAVMYGVEIFLPFLIFAPPPFREIAAGGIALFMLLIVLTGNYAFFNWLTIALCLLLISDRWYSPLADLLALNPAAPPPATWPAGIVWPVGLLLLALSVDMMFRLFRAVPPWPRLVAACIRRLLPAHLVSPYGLFAVMTKSRPEIVIEGSEDGVHWEPYEFRWKPVDPARAPAFVAPHQPRLDWQLWFAALGTRYENAWIHRLFSRLFENVPEVRGLFRKNPFPRGPAHLRAVLYDYRFTTRRERRQSGNWWVRKRLTDYHPPTSVNRETR